MEARNCTSDAEKLPKLCVGTHAARVSALDSSFAEAWRRMAGGGSTAGRTEAAQIVASSHKHASVVRGPKPIALNQ